MPEVYFFDECSIGIAGAFQADAFQNNAFQVLSGDAYAQNVTISFKKDFFGIKDESGATIKQFEKVRGVDVSIGQLFACDFAHVDGTNLTLTHANVGGTTTYSISECYLQDKNWSQSANDVIKHDVKILARTIGTI